MQNISILTWGVFSGQFVSICHVDSIALPFPTIPRAAVLSVLLRVAMPNPYIHRGAHSSSRKLAATAIHKSMTPRHVHSQKTPGMCFLVVLTFVSSSTECIEPSVVAAALHAPTRHEFLKIVVALGALGRIRNFSRGTKCTTTTFVLQMTVVAALHAMLALAFGWWRRSSGASRP